MPYSIVVLGMDGDARLVIGEVRDDVAPPLPVVDADGHETYLAIVSHEAKGPGSSAATHGKHMLSIRLGPSSTVGKMIDGLFNDVEEGVGVSLVDADSDLVGHSAHDTISVRVRA